MSAVRGETNSFKLSSVTKTMCARTRFGRRGQSFYTSIDWQFDLSTAGNENQAPFLSLGCCYKKTVSQASLEQFPQSE